MTGPAISYAGVQATDINLMIPYVGLWVADVRLSGSLPAPSVGPLVVGNLTLQGAVHRSATFGGVTSARLVAGFGGWQKSVAERGYSLPFGITLSTILADVAAEVGEIVAVLADYVIGTYWSRPAGPAGSVLRAAAGPSWWANAAGAVQVGPRAVTPIKSDFQATEWDGASGIMSIATEDPASWQPGATFISPFVSPLQTVACVRHMADNAGVSRMRVMVQ